jgi:hypothetical protein
LAGVVRASRDDEERRQLPKHRDARPSTWRSIFTVERDRWKTVRSFVFDWDLGETLKALGVVALGLFFTVAGLVEGLVLESWNVALLAAGIVFSVAGSALAFFVWVDRSKS